MLNKTQETVAVCAFYFAALFFFLVVFSAIFPTPVPWYPYLCWCIGFTVAFNLMWFGLMRLYRRHLQPRILKQC